MDPSSRVSDQVKIEGVAYSTSNLEQMEKGKMEMGKMDGRGVTLLKQIGNKMHVLYEKLTNLVSRNKSDTDKSNPGALKSLTNIQNEFRKLDKEFSKIVKTSTLTMQDILGIKQELRNVNQNLKTVAEQIKGSDQDLLKLLQQDMSKLEKSLGNFSNKEMKVPDELRNLSQEIDSLRTELQNVDQHSYPSPSRQLEIIQKNVGDLKYAMNKKRDTIPAEDRVIMNEFLSKLERLEADVNGKVKATETAIRKEKKETEIEQKLIPLKEKFSEFLKEFNESIRGEHKEEVQAIMRKMVDALENKELRKNEIKNYKKQLLANSNSEAKEIINNIIRIGINIIQAYSK